MIGERPQPKAFAALCGRVFRDADPQYFPSAEHRGRKILLCTEACLGAFLADPDVFCKVHRNSDKAANHVVARRALVLPDTIPNAFIGTKRPPV